MPRQDYYNVLGVGRDASSDDIKRAFRALALKFHPDRNDGDTDTARRFREVAEAYKVLGDPEQRQRYDRLGPLYRQDGRPPSPDDLNSFVSEALGNLFRKRRPDRGEDLRYTISVTLEDVAGGIERTFSVQRAVVCKRCEGDGADPPEGRIPCDRCNGTGRTPQMRLFRSHCPHCDGTGHKVVVRCKKCKGVCLLSVEEQLNVQIPTGVATGQKLKLRGKGNMPRPMQGKPKGTPGDLFVLISVEPHSLFQRRGAHIFCEMPLHFWEATLGTNVDVPTLTGSTTIRIPPGTPSGKTFRLAKRGLKDRASNKPGDLHFKVIVEVPTGLSDSHKEAISKLGKHLSSNTHPARLAFDKLLRERAQG